MMTKKDYITIAVAIANIANTDKFSVKQLQIITDYIALQLKRDNPQFSKEKFVLFLTRKGLNKINSELLAGIKLEAII